MRLHHTTSRKALKRINVEGILCGKAIRRRRAVWLHEKRLSAWAFLHVGKAKNIRLEETVCIEVDVPRERLRRYSDGVYYVMQDVSPERIRGVRYYGVVKEEIVKR